MAPSLYRCTTRPSDRHRSRRWFVPPRTSTATTGNPVSALIFFTFLSPSLCLAMTTSPLLLGDSNPFARHQRDVFLATLRVRPDCVDGVILAAIDDAHGCVHVSAIPDH